MSVLAGRPLAAGSGGQVEYAGQQPSAGKLRAQQALVCVLVMLASVPPVALAATSLTGADAGGPGASAAAPSPVAERSVAPPADPAVTRAAATWAREQLRPGTAVLADQNLARELTAGAQGSDLDVRVVPAGGRAAAGPGASPTGPGASPTGTGAGAVVVTPELRTALQAGTANLPAELPPLADLPLLARFGTGADEVSVHQVPPPGTAAVDRQAQDDDLARRRRAARQLADNPNLRLSDAAAATLRDGDVDARLLSVLAQLAARRVLTVQALPQPDGERGLPTARRIAHLSAVDGDPVGEGGPAIDSVTAALGAQPPAYRPTVRTRGRGQRAVLVIAYDLPSPVGLLGSATIGPSRPS